MFYEFVEGQTNEDLTDSFKESELRDFFTSINVPEDLKEDYIAKCASEFISPKMLLSLNHASLKELNIRKIDRLAIRQQSRQQAVTKSSNETQFELMNNRFKKLRKKNGVLKNERRAFPKIIQQTTMKVCRSNLGMSELVFAEVASQMRELFDSDRQKYEAFAEHCGVGTADIDKNLADVMNYPLSNLRRRA